MRRRRVSVCVCSEPLLLMALCVRGPASGAMCLLMDTLNLHEATMDCARHAMSQNMRHNTVPLVSTIAISVCTRAESLLFVVLCARDLQPGVFLLTISYLTELQRTHAMQCTCAEPLLFVMPYGDVQSVSSNYLLIQVRLLYSNTNNFFMVLFLWRLGTQCVSVYGAR